MPWRLDYIRRGGGVIWRLWSLEEKLRLRESQDISMPDLKRVTNPGHCSGHSSEKKIRSTTVVSFPANCLPKIQQIQQPWQHISSAIIAVQSVSSTLEHGCAFASNVILNHTSSSHHHQRWNKQTHYSS
eukprot:scaffold74564_cov56-Cyclotella_meneghiniana.AAC.2